MTRIIAISNQKGGVGKTTSSLNIASAIALEGKKVLLIDLDPQSNLTKSFGITDPEKNIYGVLLKEYPIKETVFKVRDNLLLVPCSKNFAAFERNNSGDIESFYTLKEQLDEITSKTHIDFIVIDCPPSLGIISTNAYVAAHEIYTPMEAQEFSIDGLEEVIKTIAKIKKRLNEHLELKGVFFTRFHGRKLISKEVQEYLQEFFPNLLLQTSIRECVRLKESPSARQDIFGFAPDSNGAADYRSLAQEILYKVP